MTESKKITVAHRLLAPRVVYLVGTKNEHGEPNIIPVSNVTSVSTAPQHVAVAVFREWQTCQSLLVGEGFTISVPKFDQLETVWKLGAKYSGFSTNSVAEKLRVSGAVLDHTLSIFGPVVPDSIGWMSCRTISRIDLCGNHVTFVGEVEEVWFNQNLLREDGTPIGSVAPVMQQTGNLFTTAADNSSTVSYFEK